jgi:hypothetical protein
MLRQFSERVHCHHGAANCPRARVEVVFAKCPPSDGEEHCSRTWHSRSGLRGKLMVHNPSNVEKQNEHALGRAAALPRLLRSWGSWTLPLRRLLFGLGIITVDPTLVPSDDLRHEELVIQGMLTKLLTNCNMVLFLFGDQNPGHEIFSNALRVQITSENCVHSSI